MRKRRAEHPSIEKESNKRRKLNRREFRKNGTVTNCTSNIKVNVKQTIQLGIGHTLAPKKDRGVHVILDIQHPRSKQILIDITLISFGEESKLHCK